MTELLTASQTAKRLGLVYGTLAVWRCTQRKSLPFVRIGRKIFYREQDIESFIAANLYPGDGPRLKPKNGRVRRETAAAKA